MNSRIKDWIQSNLWNLLVTAVVIVAAWVSLNNRVSAVENKVKDYPSEEWFELKFDTIDAELKQIKSDLKEHVNK